MRTQWYLRYFRMIRSGVRFIRGFHLADVPFLGVWLWSLRPTASALADHVPWVAFQARRFLEQKLPRNAAVFEWGSGGSTLFFMDRVSQLVSIEHEQSWYNAVSALCVLRGGVNMQRMCIEAGAGRAAQARYYSTDTAYAAYNFYDYCRSIDRYPDAWFDVIMVDGRARNGCIYHAIPKLKQQGLLLVDNTDRPAYTMGRDMLINAGFVEKRLCGLTPYALQHSCTSIFYKP